MFRNRTDAGRQLAEKLQHLKGHHPVVLALPRGGVPVGFEIARALGAPLDIVLVRKIGVPWQPELALGAITDGDDPEVFIDRNLATGLAISEDYIKKETARQLDELERRRRHYRAGRAPLDIAGRTAIVVDDGIATGATMRVALQATRRRNPARLVLATPVAAAETIARLRPEADEVVCVDTPDGLGAIGFCYHDFRQVSDAEVVAILARAGEGAEGGPVAGQRSKDKP
ncbi:MAG TPA: phosphoribosyltransferase [Stellaceae bacterium]|nr:phosphoribosyltransferase [Stellaceae bacterium]